MRYFFCLLAASLLAITPAAHADSFQVIFNSSVQESISNTNNDNYMGVYQTSGSSWGSQSGVFIGTPDHGNSPFSDISFFVPEGTYITSATLSLRVTSNGSGPAKAFFSGGGRLPLHPPDTSNPISIPATIGDAITSVSVEGLGSYSDCCISGIQNGDFTVFDLSLYLLTHGNKISTQSLSDLNLWVYGGITADIAAQGYNFASYVGGEGQVTLPYSLELSGTYSPVPEPSTIAMLGTGLVGLAGVARRKFAA